MNRINLLLCLFLCLFLQTAAMGATKSSVDTSNGTGIGGKQSERPAATSTQPPTTPSGAPVTTPNNDPSSEPVPVTAPPLPAGTSVHQTSETPAPPKPEPKLSPAASHPRLSLILAGGGARGIVHIGVLKVLEAEEIHPDFITGSSAGSMIGALYSAGVPVAKIEELALNGAMKKALMPVPIFLQATQLMVTYPVKRLLAMKPDIALYSGKSIERFMRRNLPPDRQCIEQFPIHFTALATNDLDTRPVWISEGDAAQAVRASSSVPFVFAPVRLHGRALIDGGVRQNLPTEPAAAQSAPITVAVRCYSDLAVVKDQESLNTIKRYSDRVVALLLAEIESKATASANVVIEPKNGSMYLYSFDRASIERAIAAGEEATRPLIPQIKKLLQMTDETATVIPQR